MLEKILKEIIEQLKAEGCIIDNDVGHRAVDIIRKHMNDKTYIGDLISRQALLDDFRNTITEQSDTMDWLNMIARQKAVSMNDGWIPCEERLPEESGHYRVTVRDTELGDITEETAWFAHVDDYDMNKSEWRELYEYTEVIAWRELDPYRPEKGEEIETKQDGTRKED